MIAAFFLLDWFRAVPANVVANVIALAVGVAATRAWSKLANRRIWSLGDPSKLVIFVAEDSLEYVDKGSASYVRAATGVGQVRALALIAPSLRTAYRKVDLGKVIMSGDGINRDLRSDLITLGGAKNNLVTREIMNRLSTSYVLPVPSPAEGLNWINREGTVPQLYEADGGPNAGDHLRDDRIKRDYGVIVKAPNPWNPKATVIVIYGASTHGTAAAASFFVQQKRRGRPEHFTALVEVSIADGYNGEPTLCDLHPLAERAPRPQTRRGPEIKAFLE